MKKALTTWTVVGMALTLAWPQAALAGGSASKISKQVRESFAENGPQRSVLKPVFNDATRAPSHTPYYQASKGSTSASSGGSSGSTGGGNAGTSGATSLSTGPTQGPSFTP